MIGIGKPGGRRYIAAIVSIFIIVAAQASDNQINKDTATNKVVAVNKDTTVNKDTATNKVVAVSKDTTVNKDSTTNKVVVAAKDTTAPKDSATNIVVAVGKDMEVNKQAATHDFMDLRALAFGAFSTQKKNPATLGLVRTTKNELIVPLFPAIEAGYWSNRLALPLYVNAMDSGKLADYIDIVLDRSFKTADLDPGSVSDRILNNVSNGATICARTRATFLALTTKLGSLTAHSSIDAQVDIPKAFFAVVFGDDQGLTPGSSFDFKGLKAEAVVYSTISASYGRPFSSPPLKQFIDRLSHGFLDFSSYSWGVGLDYVMGHALFKEKTLDGTMKVTKRDGIDAVAIDGKVEMTTAGGGFHGKWETPESFGTSNFFPGSGVGLSAGIALAGPHMSLGLSLNSLGFIRWDHVKKVVYTVKDTSVSLARLLTDTIVTTKPGKSDSLKEAPAFFQSLPTSISLATGYTFLFHKRPKNFRAFFQYTTIAFQYDQNCAPWPTHNYIPRIGLGVEDGAIFGFVPIRCGFFAGGGEYYGSSLGLGLNTRFVKIYLGYTAYGALYFYSRRGMALSANIIGGW